MLNFLFPRLTADRDRGAETFAAIVALSRDPSLYRSGGVPDSLDGRFAALATVTALALVRMERDGEAGEALSVAVTERFIEAMEAEHRELGMSDPTLGKTVRKLVGQLSRRVDAFRTVSKGTADWSETVQSSLYKQEPSAAERGSAVEYMRSTWQRLLATPLDKLAEGKVA